MNFSRRRFLLCGSFSALVAGTPALAERISNGISAAITVPFFGNPNATITAIGGRIASTRTSGKIPCFIQVDASTITCIGTRVDGSAALPYEDLSYVWNFGDANGTETLTNPTTGATVNANSDQTGPGATYVYRKVGNFLITLIVSGKNGSGFTTGTFTQKISVAAFTTSKEFWFDNNHGLDTNPGTKARPFQSISKLNSVIAGGNVWCHLAQGSDFSVNGTFAGTIGITVPTAVNNLRFDSYVGASGASANPIVVVNKAPNSNTRWPLNLNSPGAIGQTKDDIVVSNIDFSNRGLLPGANGAVPIGIVGAIYSNNGNTGTLSNVYLDTCNLMNECNVVQGPFLLNGDGTILNIGLWKCKLADPIGNGFMQRGTGSSLVSGVTIDLTNGGSNVDLSGVVTTPGPTQTWINWTYGGQAHQFPIASVVSGSGTPTARITVGTFGGVSPTITFGAWYLTGPGHAIFGGPQTWWSIVGCFFEGATQGDTGGRVHHIYPETQHHSLYKWNTFGATGTATGARRSYCVNTNHDTEGNAGPLDHVNWVVFSQNLANGGSNSAARAHNTVYFHDLGNNLNDPRTMQYINIVDEGNYLGNLGSMAFLYANGASHTIRDNRIWGSALLQPYQGIYGVLKTSIYRNDMFGGPIAYFSANPVPSTFTANSSVILMTYPFIVDGTRCRLSGGSLPSNWSAGVDYYVVGSVRPLASISSANPAVVTESAPHKLKVGDEICFATRGTLPTGIIAGQIYYVLVSGFTASQFQFSETPAGAPFDTSGGAGSGTHYLTSQVTLGDHGVVGGAPASGILLSRTPGGAPNVTGASAGSGTFLTPIGTVPQTWTDNRIEADGASVNFASMTFADQAAALTIIDRNQYYAPNVKGGQASANLFDDKGTRKTWTQWRASGFDPNGSLSSGFGWADPVNGAF